MLDRAGNADRDVKLGRDHLAGLPDLPIVGRIARVDRGARGAHRRAELVGHRLDERLEVLRLLHRAAAGDDNSGRREFRSVRLGERRLDPILGDVVEGDLIARLRADEGDAGAHLPRSDDADFLDCRGHRSILGALPAGTYNETRAQANAGPS